MGLSPTPCRTETRITVVLSRPPAALASLTRRSAAACGSLSRRTASRIAAGFTPRVKPSEHKSSLPLRQRDFIEFDVNVVVDTQGAGDDALVRLPLSLLFCQQPHPDLF